MVRSAIAVSVGFFAIVLLSLTADSLLWVTIPGAFSEKGRVEAVPLLLFMLAYVFAFSSFGCWLAARIAGRHRLRHALIVGGLELIFGLVATLTFWETAPAWYHILYLLIMFPAAWVGGTIAARQPRLRLEPFA